MVADRVEIEKMCPRGPYFHFFPGKVNIEKRLSVRFSCQLQLTDPSYVCIGTVQEGVDNDGC